jgi:hypothetical protein
MALAVPPLDARETLSLLRHTGQWQHCNVISILEGDA